ncbi:hypothetical protein [Chromobacterium amazonense]|uniref:hypothetical protein n=1 Tax=Chromobacterium amazonense TaxID=1382803 RepID=UPI0031F69FA1
MQHDGNNQWRKYLARRHLQEKQKNQRRDFHLEFKKQHGGLNSRHVVQTKAQASF